MRRRLRWPAALVFALAVAVAVAIGLRGTGADSPQKAIYAVAHDLGLRNRDDLCARVILSTSLPVDIARELRVGAAGGGERVRWQDARRGCARGSEPRFDADGFADARVRTVAIMRVAASGEVTRTATAQVSSGQGGAHTVELIEYGGSWKIVLDVN